MVEVLLVDRAVFPRRKACGSGLSPWALRLLDELGVGARVRGEAHPIRAAIIGMGGAGPVELRGSHEAAVLLRERFDALLVGEAVARGAHLHEGILVRSLVSADGRVAGVVTQDGVIEADAVIDCSGAHTRISRAPRPGRTLHAIMGWYEGVAGVSDAVELYFDPVVRPYYGWVFPETATRVNVGICYAPAAGAPNARERFDSFVVERLGTRMRAAERLGGLVGHPIATTHRPSALVGNGLLVAGEAARLVDPATAEGIYEALSSGRLAGDVLGRVLEDGLEPTTRNLAAYGRAVRRELGWRLLAGRVVLGVLRTPVLDIALRLGSRRGVRAGLTRLFASA